MRIKVIKSYKDNWYKPGDVFLVKDAERYEIGVQVYKKNNDFVPDVVQHGHYEVLKDSDN